MYKDIHAAVVGSINMDLILNMKKYIFAATFVAFLSACSLNANKNEIDTNQNIDTVELNDTVLVDSSVTPDSTNIVTQ